MTSITAPAAADDPTLQPGPRHATRAQFFALGFLAGAWGVHVPSVKAHYRLSEGQLSLALLGVALGAVLCMLVAGRVVHAVGPRRVVVAAGLAGAGAFAALLLPSSLPVLLLLTFVMGAAMSLFDVSVNTEGALLEKRSGLKVMSGFHGMWSLGGMAGAGLGGLMLSQGVAPGQQLALMAVAMVLLVLVAQAYMLRGASAGHDDIGASADEGQGQRRRPAGLLLLLGALGVSGLLAEGAIYDWSVLWMQQELQQSQANAALAYASFAAAMAANRFAGDWLRSRIAPQRMLAVAGFAAAAAMAVALLVRQPAVAVLGFVIVGAGLANLVPIIFYAASHVPGVPPATGIATVSGLGYVGFVVGPPLIGWIAEATSLTGALWVVVVALLLQGIGARWIPR